MQIVPIQPLPNQEFTIQLDGNSFDIILKSASGITAVSIAINTVPIIKNMRAVSAMRLIPSQYQESGNFAFSTLNYEMPYYAFFGVSQFLIYTSAAELQQLRRPPAEPITLAFFNPIAAPALRFSPKGY